MKRATVACSDRSVMSASAVTAKESRSFAWGAPDAGCPARLAAVRCEGFNIDNTRAPSSAANCGRLRGRPEDIHVIAYPVIGSQRAGHDHQCQIVGGIAKALPPRRDWSGPQSVLSEYSRGRRGNGVWGKDYSSADGVGGYWPEPAPGWDCAWCRRHGKPGSAMARAKAYVRASV